MKDYVYLTYRCGILVCLLFCTQFACSWHFSNPRLLQISTTSFTKKSNKADYNSKHVGILGAHIKLEKCVAYKTKSEESLARPSVLT
jgi:hypothetical protein